MFCVLIVTLTVVLYVLTTIVIQAILKREARKIFFKSQILSTLICKFTFNISLIYFDSCPNSKIISFSFWFTHGYCFMLSLVNFYSFLYERPQTGKNLVRLHVNVYPFLEPLMGQILDKFRKFDFFGKKTFQKIGKFLCSCQTPDVQLNSFNILFYFHLDVLILISFHKLFEFFVIMTLLIYDNSTSETSNSCIITAV